MNTLRLILPHFGDLAKISVSLLWPPNLTVVARNAASAMFGRPWEEYLQRHGGLNANSFDKVAASSLDWLSMSQDKLGSGGVACYEFHSWTPGYPEVTGYIIPTFWDASHFLNRPDLGERAIRMTDWELSIQMKNGAFEGGYFGTGQPAVVFNTGQIIRGLLRSYLESNEEKYLTAAIRASDWIVSVQDDDGSWTLSNFKQMKRVYDTYVSAALAQMFIHTRDDKYRAAAIRNCEFAIGQQQPNGWFALADNTLYYCNAPVTHTIAYTMDGLIETGILLERPDFIAAGTKTADKLMHSAEINGVLWGRFDNKWRAQASWICVTGVAQTGISLLRLYKLENDPRRLNTALKLADLIAYVQSLNGVGKNRTGGIVGAYPVWGMYCPFKYPSWAAKYAIDFMLAIREEIK